MSKETLEQLRERLLQDEQVRKMIALRAFQIYELRGRTSGHEAEDWFQAENEILIRLINEETRRIAEQETQQALAEISLPDSEGGQSASAGAVSATAASAGAASAGAVPAPEIEERQDQPSAQTAEERAESQSELGVWSPAQPASEERAPEIGAAAATATRKRAATKSATPKSAATRKRKTEGEPAATKPAAAKKSAAKSASTGKAPAKRAASKKSTEDAATKKTSRRRSAKSDAAEGAE